MGSLIRAVVLTACLLAAIPAAAGADVFVSDSGAFGGGGGIIRVDTTTGARSVVSQNAAPVGGPAFVDPLGVVIAPNGDLLVADQNAFAGAGGGVIRVNPATGQRTTVSENASPAGGPAFVDPFALTLAANGDILVSDQNAFGGGGGVIRVNPTTGARTVVTQNTAPPGGPLFDAPFGITTEANGNIVVADATLAALVRVNPATGARTVLSDNTTPAGSPAFNDPYGIARAANGDIVVGDGFAFNGAAGLIRANPLTGARTTITQNTAPAGGPAIVSPTGVALGPNGVILVADPSAFGGGSGGIIRVDPATGARSTLSENAAPVGGPAFVDPWGLAVGPEASQPPPPPPPPGELPAPVLGRSANVAPVSGTVLVALPGGRSSARARAAQKGLHFVPLTEARQIPVGSFLDTKRGRVRLTTATTAGGTQTGDFYAGLFQALQSRKKRDKGITELRLKGSSFKRCTVRRRGKRAIASKRRLSKRTIRRVSGNAKGRFRTRGRHSAATVRGTIWTVADRCDGTLTTVKRGRVAVRDFRRKKTVLVRAGKRYLARARR
ncbi:MAG TPA: hypothetical protein VGF25_03920 [Thermoleophilaceae bacterium]